MKKVLLEENSKISAWKIAFRKKENLCCAYIVLKKAEALDTMTKIFAKAPLIRVSFLKGLGKCNELLQPLMPENPNKSSQRI